MDWNAAYENQETPWDKGLPTPVLGEVLQKHPGLLEGRVLVPGCGLGHDAREIAKSATSVVGADIAPLALEKAAALDPEGLVDFQLIDMLAPAAEWHGSFDAVWEHTCLCALEPVLRLAYAQSVSALLKPRGVLVGVFFINPEMDPGESGPPFGITAADLEALWHQVGLVPVDSWVPQTGYGGRVGRELAMILKRK